MILPPAIIYQIPLVFFIQKLFKSIHSWLNYLRNKIGTFWNSVCELACQLLQTGLPQDNHRYLSCTEGFRIFVFLLLEATYCIDEGENWPYICSSSQIDIQGWVRVQKTVNFTKFGNTNRPLWARPLHSSNENFSMMLISYVKHSIWMSFYQMYSSS